MNDVYNIGLSFSGNTPPRRDNLLEAEVLFSYLWTILDIRPKDATLYTKLSNASDSDILWNVKQTQNWVSQGAVKNIFMKIFMYKVYQNKAHYTEILLFYYIACVHIFRTCYIMLFLQSHIWTQKCGVRSISTKDVKINKIN